jgi:tetratricopeptide (TPR) repeat protein
MPSRALRFASLVSLAALALVSTGCPDKRETPAATASSSAAGDAGAAVKAGEKAGDAGAPKAGVADGGARASTKPALSPDQRKAVLKALGDGRKKARAKDYKGALAAFDRALAIAPDDGRVLSEVGYAAMLGGDLTRAEAANKRALTSIHDKTLRAQVLYNAGRVAESKSATDAARAAYAESLTLRENVEVRKRLESVGGATAYPQPCPGGAPTPEALCACLLDPKLEWLFGPPRAPVCNVTPDSLGLGTPRLSVLRVGAPEDDTGELHYLLLARDGGTVRPVANLGTRYEPGAFGVHNDATIGKGAPKTFGKRSVFVVTSHQSDVDMNLAGLEACTVQEDRETVCALGEGARPTRCVTVAVSVEAGCGAGVEPEASDTEAQAMIAEAKVHWGSKKTKKTWSVADDGSLVVRDDANKATAYTLF